MSPETLRRLGRHVADRQDAALEQAAPDEALRERLEARAASRRFAAPPPRYWRLGAGVAAIVATLGAGMLLLRGEAPDPPIRFEVGSERRAGHVHAWMSAPADARLPLRFSDGSTVQLEAGARARVVETTTSGAELVVERGAALVDVVHREGTSWRVRSGPYVVHVTGTRFSVDWDAARDTVTVRLEEGTVRVSGCRLGVPGQSLSAGQRLEASCAAGRTSVVPLSEEPTSPSPSVVRAPSEPEAATRSEPIARGARPVVAKTSPPVATDRSRHDVSWQQLARDGRYAESIRRASSLGLGREMTRAEASDLLLLGDAARLGGHATEAPRIYASVRERFPGSPEGARAAFNLGRLDSMGGRYDGAARWYETYLLEQPGGPFAEAALGRLMEARARVGDMTAARAAATRYLEAFPRGAHADDAARVLESSH